MRQVEIIFRRMMLGISFSDTLLRDAVFNLYKRFYRGFEVHKILDEWPGIGVSISKPFLIVAIKEKLG
jgi:hypothetical protein